MRVAFSPPKTSRRSGASVILLVVFLCAALAAVVSIPMVQARQARPVIEAIEPPIGDPGGALLVRGRNFGKERGEGTVEFDGAAVTSSSYLSWSEGLIQVRVPLYADSSLVRVVTESGRSNPRMFMSRSLLPSAPAGTGGQALGPSIESLSSDSGVMGSLLTIRGLNYGSNRGDSSVLFTWMGESAVQARTEDTGRGYVTPIAAFGEYESWSDKEIRVRVPDGAITGGVAVRTAKGTSQVRYFQVVDVPGSKSYLGRRTYALSTFVTISRVQSGGQNSLYLWMPFPVNSPSQQGVKALNRSVEPLFPDYRGLSAYKLGDLAPDSLTTVSQDYLVQVYGVETDVKPEKIKTPPAPVSSLYEVFTAPDALVPADNPALKAFAAKAVGREKNPYRIAALLHEALVATVQYDATAVAASSADALEAARADAWDMAILYTALLRAAKVPAVPVAGVVVDDALRAWNHAWAEFYVYGFGWIPVDPVLASGAIVGDFVPPFDDRSRYFGNMDDRHIAFSRGLTTVDRMAPDGNTVAALRRYSFQTIFEESGGDLPSYTSFWSDVEITGVY
ncbi:MAG: IPT/TIG domain-containing protein [Spirochaetales bacterium]|nr:IPT/TIG domain-containing protein [Spirochaetales bacterium]